ncbi:periplasmic binding protein [Gloeocapsa sp. PCC 7428]|uniref:iron-siderophore ABC transporter substrate-binding protein n=1 Tax=Gloeocapsa sp. PCC 7428 TaxID=1173026 RepID=UPI0002A6066B|nr:iron-siderophore ABC transporter substrate-binding protein [Gloeocapsa sp. PCC 7428]AFZ30781.1 periplasmic binding protein [Gloeocapsa sp. PCC 7428]
MRISVRRFVYWLVLGILTATILIACNSVNTTRVTNNQPQAENCRIVKHTMGETCVPRNPQRIIVLREDTLANSLALGVKPIASVFASDLPLPSYLQGKIDGIESVGGYEAPSIEKMLQLKPDLILGNFYYSKTIYNQLSQIAPTVILNIPYPPPSWKEQLEELAQVLGKEDVSQKLINDYWQRIEKLKQALGNRHSLVVSVASTSSQYGIWAYGQQHFSGTVLNDVGLQRPPAQQGDFFYVENISEEKIADIDGDVLFFLTWEPENDKKALEKLKQRPLWRQLEVVQRNQVYFVGTHWHDAAYFAINMIVDDLFKYLVNTP